MAEERNLTGYAHPDYVRSLAEFGQPRFLPNSKGWLLEREIPGSSFCDAIGPYPLFFCENWRELRRDWASVEGVVSVCLVTDPFAPVELDSLRSSFDLVQPFKEHFITDLEQPLEKIVSKSHRESVRWACRHVDVEVVAKPAAHLHEWIELFSHLSRRHQIHGIRAFSAHSFATQLSLPGLVMLRATERETGQLVGLDLWYQQDEIAYGHLVAFNDRGYELKASYATKWHLLTHFKDKVRFVDLGGVSGLQNQSANHGLVRFKKGWSNATRTNYFCGSILNIELYQQLVQNKASERGSALPDFFPLYRAGEF